LTVHHSVDLCGSLTSLKGQYSGKTSDWGKPLSIVNASPTFREVQTEAGKQLDEMAEIVETVLAKEVHNPFTTHPEIYLFSNAKIRK
jgi:hypothetical protein